jgi:hypothetical protein
MAAILAGRFTDRREADRAAAALRAAGYSPETIGLIPEQREDLGPPPVEAAKGSTIGAVIGSLLGGTLFAAAGWLLAASIPGLDRTAGWVVLFLALAGGTIGWVVGSVVGSRKPVEQEEYRREAIEQGRMTLTVDAGDRPAEARDILMRFGGTQVREVHPDEAGDYRTPPDTSHGAPA